MKNSYQKLSKNEKIAVFVGLIFVGIYLIVPTFNFGSTLPVVGSTKYVLDVQSGELIIHDIEVGSGLEVEFGDILFVHYSGSLIDGTIFDSSYDRSPYSFVLGNKEVIRGWEEGFVGMREGGTRFLIIPPEFGYGNYSVASIPPNSTLIFEVVLLKIDRPER